MPALKLIFIMHRINIFIYNNVSKHHTLRVYKFQLTLLFLFNLLQILYYLSLQ